MLQSFRISICKERITIVYLVSISNSLCYSILLFNKVVLKLRKQFANPETKALLTYLLFLVIYTYFANNPILNYFKAK